MARGAPSPTTDGYLGALLAVAPDQIAAVYAVGSVALGDFSARQSNVDLVVVADPRLDPGQLQRLSGAVRGMHRAGRDAAVWHVTWEDLDAGGPGSASTAASDAAPTLATPMTRAILRNDPMALFGPDWPIVAHDREALKDWCLQRLRALASAPHGPLVMRRAIGPLVLEAARLAQGSITGRVLSKSEAGELTLAVVSTSHQRVLTDAVGYRRGAQTSMYWGPFERKYDALALMRELLDLAAAPGTPSPTNP
jgi:hypothetical protein